MTNIDDEKPSLIKTLGYLALGSILLGIDQIQKITNENQSIINSIDEDMPITSEDFGIDSLMPDEKSRYALIGMTVKATQGIHRSATFVEQLLNSASLKIGRILRPISESRMMRPVKDHIENLVEKGEQIVDEWIETGMKSEKASRKITRQTVDQATGSIILMVADKPEVQDLIQQQSVGMFQEISENLQGKTAAADTLLERIVFKILPGSKRDTTPTVIVPLIDEENTGS